MSERASGAVLEGTALFALFVETAEAGRPCRLDYRIACDAAWRTLTARVEGWLGEETLALDVAADGARRWTLNGAAVPAVDGARTST